MPASIDSAPPSRPEADFDSSFTEPRTGIGNLVDLYALSSKADIGTMASGSETAETQARTQDSDTVSEGEAQEKPKDTAKETKKDSLPVFGLDFNIDFGALNNDSTENRTEENEDSKESSEEREKRFSERFKAVTGQDSVIEEGPEAELHMWADSWRDFVEVAEVPEGPFRDLLQEVGSQMLLGEMDGAKIAKMMKEVKPSQELEETVEALNDYDLKQYQARLNLDFDDTGHLKKIELEGLARDQEVEAKFGFNSRGKLITEGKDPEAKEKKLSEEEVIKRVAMKVSPLACP